MSGSDKVYREKQKGEGDREWWKVGGLLFYTKWSGGGLSDKITFEQRLKRREIVATW